ncbi:MAG: hypothetical protein IKZ26_03670 [Peptococcaceae bacterium]|nr:hypothetical protein [Peptococcaceae bacterium]
MELQQICWELFRQNGQIGYYLLGCRIKQEEVESGGTVPACERNYSAQQRL